MWEKLISQPLVAKLPAPPSLAKAASPHHRDVYTAIGISPRTIQNQPFKKRTPRILTPKKSKLELFFNHLQTQPHSPATPTLKPDSYSPRQKLSDQLSQRKHVKQQNYKNIFPNLDTQITQQSIDSATISRLLGWGDDPTRNSLKPNIMKRTESNPVTPSNIANISNNDSSCEHQRRNKMQYVPMCQYNFGLLNSNNTNSPARPLLAQQSILFKVKSEGLFKASKHIKNSSIFKKKQPNPIRHPSQYLDSYGVAHTPYTQRKSAYSELGGDQGLQTTGKFKPLSKPNRVYIRKSHHNIMSDGARSERARSQKNDAMIQVIKYQQGEVENNQYGFPIGTVSGALSSSSKMSQPKTPRVLKTKADRQKIRSADERRRQVGLSSEKMEFTFSAQMIGL